MKGYPRIPLVKRHTTQQLLACLALAAYVVSGSGLASQFVYCIGEDGHSAIERAHAAGPCESSREHVESGAVTVASDSCTDLPLLVQASKEGERLGGTKPTLYVVTTVFVLEPRRSAPRLRSTSDLAFTLQDTASQRATVLRV